MKKLPLGVYVIGVLVVLILLNYLSWVIVGTTRFHTTLSVSFGFLLGMLAMYIAMHIYRWK